MNPAVIISFLGFLSLVAIIAVYKTVGQRLNTAAAYFLGNRSLGAWMVGSSLFLTNISTNQFIGENEYVYTTDMSVMAWGMSSILAMLVVAEWFLPVYLKMGVITTPDLLERRYDKSVKQIVSLIFLVNYLVNVIPSVLYGSAVAINGIFHINEHFHISYLSAIWILVILVAFIGCCYTILGGLRAITVSNMVQGAGMVLGGVLLIWYGLRRMGDGQVQAGLYKVLHLQKQHLNAIGHEQGPIPFSTLFTGMFLINLYYWGMEQYIVQQVLASRSLKEGQKGMSLACAGKLIAPLFLNIPGLIAVHLYPHLVNSAAVYPRLVGDVLPPVLTGFMVAIVFGSAIGCFNACLNSAGTLFIMNLYKPAAKKPLSESSLVRTGRIFQLITAFIAMCCSPFILYFQGGFYNYIQKVSSFFSVPVFTILLVGILTKRVPALAAKVGLVFFITAYVLTQTVWDTGLHYLHVLAILFIISAAIMLLIGRFRPMPVPYIAPNAAIVSMEPWKNKYWYFALLLLLMTAMFILFSKMGLAR